MEDETDGKWIYKKFFRKVKLKDIEAYIDLWGQEKPERVSS